jgi:hypothetical protein
MTGITLKICIDVKMCSMVQLFAKNVTCQIQDEKLRPENQFYMNLGN